MKSLDYIISHRTWWLVIIPIAILLWFLNDDPAGGKQLLIQLQTFVSPFIALTFAYLGRRALLRGDAKEAWNSARKGSISNGLLVLSSAILMGFLFIGFSGRALADSTTPKLPGMAERDLPILVKETRHYWPTFKHVSILAAQVEQESLWRPNAELKTARENGFGYAQFTRAYKSDGSLRFDAMADAKRKHRELAGWNWANRFDPTYQLRAAVLTNKTTYNRLRPLVTSHATAVAMMDAAHNCGEGCVMQRQRLCGRIEGCNPDRWFSHMEKYSGQSKKKWKGYGQSAHDITNTHVRNVIVVRRPKYVKYLKET